MKSSSQDRALSIEELSTAMAACFANAEELTEEASFLTTIGHQARAFFLYHTACEELAKFFILQMAGMRAVQGSPPNWKRFWQRLRSHDSKLAQIEVRVRVPLETDTSEDRELIDAGLDLLFNYGALPRNTGLYVDLDPNQIFRKPSDIDWSLGLAPIEAVTKRMLHVAEQSGKTADLIAMAIQQGPTDEMRKHAEGALTHTIRRLESAGVEKEEVIRQFQKHFSS